MPLWFRAKRYGYGWTPATWQGWAVTAAHIALTLAGALWLLRAKPITPTYIFEFIAYTLVLAIALLIICKKTGEPARWRWGGDD